MLSSPPQDSLVWLGPRGNVWSKHKGSYGLILVRFFLSGGKTSNCRRRLVGDPSQFLLGHKLKMCFKHPLSSQFFCLRGSQANKGLGTAPEGLGGL